MTCIPYISLILGVLLVYYITSSSLWWMIGCVVHPIILMVEMDDMSMSNVLALESDHIVSLVQSSELLILSNYYLYYYSLYIYYSE